jgi:hypothetical protein
MSRILAFSHSRILAFSHSRILAFSHSRILLCNNLEFCFDTIRGKSRDNS